MSDAVAEAKRRIRAQIAARAAALDPGSAREAAERAARHLERSAQWAAAARVALYAAVADEMPTDPIGALADRDGKRVLWPRVAGPGLELVPARRSGLVPGRFGIPAPPVGTPAEAPGPDLLVVVPGRAFDRAGARVGRGAGYYDRLLATARGAVAIGLAFSWQVLEDLPRAPHDRPVDALLTEDGLEVCARGAP